MHRCEVAVLAALVLLVSVVPDVWAQVRDAPEVAITIQGLASVQPVDDSYVGSPYLDKGLGGVGPGVAIGLNVAARRRLAFAIEFSTATMEVTQSGRLVSGTAVGQLRDSLFSFLAGASAWSSANAEVVALAGLSLAPGTPTQNGVPIDAWDDPAAREGGGSIAFSGGVNVTRRVGRRVGLVGSVRYSALPRSRRAEELGAGTHVFRIGVGVHVRLTR